jgi:hypothetical protein
LELEDLSAYEFFANYDVRVVTASTTQLIIPFANTIYFQHPSFVHSKKIYKQGMLKRGSKKLVKIFQYDFPDSALFDGNLLSDNIEVNEHMEKFSEHVMLLFLPHRQILDLLIEDSFTKRLRDAVDKGEITATSFQILQNIQDAKSNNLRATLVNDDLQRNTIAPNFIGETTNSTLEDDYATTIQANDIQVFQRDFDDFFTNSTLNEECNCTIPAEYNCCGIRSKGRLKCGYDKLPKFPAELMYPVSSFIQTTDATFNTTEVREDHS